MGLPVQLTSLTMKLRPLTPSSSLGLSARVVSKLARVGRSSVKEFVLLGVLEHLASAGFHGSTTLPVF
jgi:hypothetical protein